MARRRTPGLDATELRVLRDAMLKTAKEARKQGLIEKAERFERKAADYEERAAQWDEVRKPRPR